MPTVSHVIDELRAMLPDYRLIEDCIKGSNAIKKRGDVYLPRPQPENKDPANIARYDAYKVRAVFYNVTRRTLGGLTGQIFHRDPVVKVPSRLQGVIDDANGAGVSMLQLAKKACRNVLAYGRSGLFADYPSDSGAASLADIESGKVRPTVTLYDAQQIINWRVEKRGGIDRLTLVVLQEEVTVADDGFKATKQKQWRALRLIEGVYRVEVYSKDNTVPQVYNPTDFNGNSLDFIPFVFIGSENNDHTIDEPPSLDLANLNIAHYRNSADYEEAAFLVGQPTPYFAGMTEDWVNTVLNGKVGLGSRAIIPLPQGATAGLLQASEVSMPFEAMEHKERQMVALGARLVQMQEVQRTAFETGVDAASDNSTLTSTAKNVGSAIQKVLTYAGRFVGTDTGIEYTLNTEFTITMLTPEQQKALIASWQGQAITYSEMREKMRLGGIATLSDKDAKAETEAEVTAGMDQERKRLEMEHEVGGDDSVSGGGE